MDYPLVSIIIPTYNSSLTIESCLASIRLQNYPNIEVIIVDNCSKDDTSNMARKYGSRFFRIKALRSVARNYGARKAIGVFYLFVDADMELTPNVVGECIEKIERDHVDALMIPEIRVGEGFWARCRAIERLTYIGDPLIESVRFFKKRTFKSVGGFDEELEAGEDWDIHARVENAGYKIKSISSLIKHQEGKLTLKELVIKRVYYGKTLMKYIKKHPERSRIQFVPIRLDYLRHWRLLMNYPVYTCGMFLMKMIEYMAVGISIIIQSW